MESLEKFCVEAINSLPRIDPNLDKVPFRHWLKEHRTINLSLPRGCGKTTVLANLIPQFDSVLYQGYNHYLTEHFLRDNLLTNVTVYKPEDEYRFMGIRDYVFFSCLIMDEAKVTDKLCEFLALHEHLLSKDFFILRLGTDYV